MLIRILPRQTTPKTPSTTTATPRKRAAPGTGTGKGRKSSAKKSASHVLGSDGEEDREATPARKKARAADSASPVKGNGVVKAEPGVGEDDEEDVFK